MMCAQRSLLAWCAGHVERQCLLHLLLHYAFIPCPPRSNFGPPHGAAARAALRCMQMRLPFVLITASAPQGLTLNPFLARYSLGVAGAALGSAVDALVATVVVTNPPRIVFILTP